MTEVLIRNEEVARLARKILSGIATEADCAVAKIEDVIAIKSDTGIQHNRAFVGAGEKVASESGRTRRFISSQQSRDRMGDVIEIAGWDHTNFKKNAVALWAHQDRGLPLGTVPETSFGEKGGIPTMWQSIDYVPEKLNPFAEAVLGLVDYGTIKAVSVGFLPLKPPLWPKSAEEREELDLGPYGVRYTNQEQLELSNCTIPAHAGAVGASVKSIRRALTSLVEEGRISKDAAGFMLDKLAEHRSKRASWWGHSFDLEVEDQSTGDGDSNEPTVASDRKAETTVVKVDDNTSVGGQPIPPVTVSFTALPHGTYSWDGKTLLSISPVVPVVNDGQSEKLDRCLAELTELREAQSETAEAMLAVCESIEALQGVLRTSSRNADPEKFMSVLLDEAKRANAKKPQGGA